MCPFSSVIANEFLFIFCLNLGCWIQFFFLKRMHAMDLICLDPVLWYDVYLHIHIKPLTEAVKIAREYGVPQVQEA